MQRAALLSPFDLAVSGLAERGQAEETAELLITKLKRNQNKILFFPVRRGHEQNDLIQSLNLNFCKSQNVIIINSIKINSELARRIEF